MALSRIVILGSLIGLGLSTAHALDVTIDGFEGYALGDIDTVGNPPWTAEVAGVGEVRAESGNQYLSFGDNGGGDWRHLFRSSGVPLDTNGSLEFRIYIEAEAVDHAFGLADSSQDIDWYEDYGPYVRVTDDTAGAAGVVSLDARDGGAFVDDIATLNLDQWYDIRLEIDTTGGDSSLGGSNIFVDDALVYSSSDFRRPFGLPLDSVLLMGGNGSGLDVRIDDIRLVDLPDLVAVLWDENGGGNWGDATNWLDDTLPSVGDEVAFAGVLTADNAPATVNLNVPATVNKVTFTNANQYVIAGPNALTLTGLAEITSNVGSHEISAVISGTSGLNKTGAGDLILTGSNNYTGNTNIEAGGLGLIAPGSIPGNVVVDTGATLFFQGDGLGGGYNGALTNAVSGAGGVTLRNTLTTETVTFNSAKSYSGPTTIVGGTLLITGSGTLGSSDGTAASQTLVDGNASTGKLAISGGITVSNEVLTLEAREGDALDAVHVTSAGNNTWTGNVNGELGGTQYNIESTSGTLNLSGTISAPDTGDRNFVFSGAGNTNVTGRIVDLATDADGNPDALEPLSNEVNVNVIKRGAGTLTINTATDLNDDYWHGSTTIEGGTLEVRSDGANNGELRSSVAVQAGATFDIDHFATYNLLPIAPFEVGLSGAGSVQAQTLGIFESSTITPGDDGVGTLTVNGNVNLTYFDAGEGTVPNTGSLNFEIGDDASVVGGAENDLIDVNGTLTVSGNGSSQFQVNATLVENALDSGAYTLIDANTLTGSATNANFAVNLFTADGVPVTETRQTASINLNTTTDNVELAVSGAAGNITWIGNVSNVWGKGASGPLNWNSGGADRFFDLDAVTFNDSAVSSTADIDTANDEDVVAASVTFDSASNRDFTIVSTPGNGLTTSTVNITGSAGAILANNGVNNVVDVNVSGSARLQQGNGASTGTTNVAGVVSGAGQVRVDSGTLALNGNNTYTGQTVVNGGTLLVANANALGGSASGTTINGGTVRANGGTFTLAEPLSFNGGAFAVGGGDAAALTVAGPVSVGAGSGTLQLDGGTGDDGMTVTSNITGAAGGTLTASVDGGSTITFTGNVTNNGPLVKTGGGVLALNGSATVTSPSISVNNGTFDVSGVGGTMTLAGGQTLSGNDGGVFAGNVVAANGSTVRVGGAGMPVTPSQFVIDDFETYAVGDVAAVASPPWSAHAGSLTVDIQDDGGSNQALSFGSDGFNGTSRGTTFGGEVADGEVATFFFRVNAQTDDPDHSFGIADQVDTGGANFGDFEAQFRLTQGTVAGMANIDARDGGGFSASLGEIPTGVWHNVWLVVDQANDTYDIYVNTGSGGASGANLIANDFAFRNGTTAALNTILGLNGPAPVDNGVLYDDITFLAGEVLSNPLNGLSPTDLSQPELMTIDGDLSLNAGAVLALDLFDTSTFDSLSITGELSAAGTLAVSLEPAAPAPQLGDVFDLLDFATASGAFGSFSLPSLPSGLFWDTSDLLVTGELAIVGAGTPGDFDQDGNVDGSDFLLWQRNPGVGNLSDWQNNYGAGSLVASATTVPEPTSMILVAAGMFAASTLYRRGAWII